MAQSYTNPQGSGSRIGGSIISTVRALDGAISGTPGALTGTSATAINVISLPSSLAFVFDFGWPRVVDEITISRAASQPWGTWAVDGGPSDGGPWTQIGSATGATTPELVVPAHANVTAYRCYRLRWVSGGDASGGFGNVRFRIDDVVSGWGDVYSGYNRTGLINVTGLGWQHNTVISGSNYYTNTNTYFANSIKITPFTLTEAQPITGARVFFVAAGADIGTFTLQGSSDNSTWEVVHGPFRMLGAAHGTVSPVHYWEATWENTTAYRFYRWVRAEDTIPATRNLGQWIFRIGGGTSTVAVDPLPGALALTGGQPSIAVDQFAEPTPGLLRLTGNVPLIAGNEIVDAAPGGLAVTGRAPGLFLGISVTPTPGGLILESGAPEVIIYTESAAISSQLAVLAAGEMIPDVSVSQQAVLVAGYEIPPVAVSQQVVLVMADAHPCVSRLCQVWLLQRRDGEVFAFTSHDVPVKFMGHTFTPCASLNPSAVEAASDMAAVGNMELTGIIDAEGISEFDLYAGKFDDCRVDVWEIPWAGAFPHPIRLASGTTGSVSHGRDGFRGEVLGPGAKMQQQSVTQVVTAACRFTFGDSRCAKDLGPLTEAGAVSAVAASAPFRTFRADALIGSGPEGYFGRGVVTWTTGANTGVRSEVKEYDPVTGTVVLWNLLPSPASPGDAFTISPGCTLAKDGDMGCVYWGNLINFGGFPDVPGDDATAETPIAKI